MALTCHGMTPRPVTSTLGSLGLSGPEERLYARLLPLSGGEVSAVAAALGLSSTELADEIEPLRGLGICGIEDGRLRVRPLADAVSILIAQEADRAGRAEQRLTLTPGADGRASARVDVAEDGLYRVSDGTHTAYAAPRPIASAISITFSQNVRQRIAGSGPLSRIRSRGARGTRAS